MKGRFTHALRALLLAVMLMPLLAACGGADTVVIATDGNYHPFNFVNDDGEIDGLERELGDELCQRADLKCEWILSEWETMIPDLVAEEFDAILAGMSITAEREELINFTEAYYPPTPSVYVARVGEGDEAVQGTIGATVNTIYSDYFTELGRPFVSLDGSIDLAEAVLNGEVDAALVDHGYGVEKVAEYEGQLAIVGPSILLDRGLGIGVRKGGDLKGKLDEALASMKADGALNAIILRWVGERRVHVRIANLIQGVSGYAWASSCSSAWHKRRKERELRWAMPMSMLRLSEAWWMVSL